VNKNDSSKNCWKMIDGSCGLKVPVCNEMDLLTEVAFRRRKFVNPNNKIYIDYCGEVNTDLL
jgi:hypothetical protein